MHKKPLTSAERTKRNEDKMRSAGFKRANMWIHPGDAPAARDLVAELPHTAELWRKLK
jgi:hypothetical protein